MLTGVSDNNNGRLFDPIDRIGHWHNNSSYSDVHTQSPRTSSFGGGANGGMDDRFDWLFVSQSILDESSSMYYVDGTYWAFGNDGNHFTNVTNESGISNFGLSLGVVASDYNNDGYPDTIEIQEASDPCNPASVQENEKKEVFKRASWFFFGLRWLKRN